LKHDGYLSVPRQASSERVPLLVLLHGGGGRSEDFNEVLPLADDFGVAIAAIDSRDNTWDAIDSPWGPDVVSLDHALKYIFEHVPVDPARVALGGLSDGGFYALSLGLANGDLFTHLVAVAPGYIKPPRPLIGRPKILLLHGSRDNVYSVSSSLRLLPELQSAGYDVAFKEFDGPHWLPASVAREVLAWLLR
jgi:phospholipase/carboxylesterase